MANRKKKLESVEEVPTDSKGVIQEKKLMQLLYGHTKLDRIKPVSSPPEQSSTQLQARDQVNSILKAVAMARESILSESRPMWYLIVTLLATGARISEVLSLRPHDISSSGMIHLKGAKGSHNRVVSAGDATTYLSECKSKGVAPFAIFNRVFVWRYLKRKGLYTMLTDGQKASVAHMFRHIFIEQAKELSGETETVQRSIGHKSIKSTQHYETNKIKSSSRLSRNRDKS